MKKKSYLYFKWVKDYSYIKMCKNEKKNGVVSDLKKKQIKMCLTNL